MRFDLVTAHGQGGPERETAAALSIPIAFRPSRWRNAVPLAIGLLMMSGWLYVLCWPLPGYSPFKWWGIVLLMLPLAGMILGYFGYQFFAAPVVLGIDPTGVWQQRVRARVRAVPFDRVARVTWHRCGKSGGLAIEPFPGDDLAAGSWAAWWPELQGRHAELRAFGISDQNATIPLGRIVAVIEERAPDAVIVEVEHRSWRDLEGTLIRQTR